MTYKNSHHGVMEAHGSAYAMAKATGIPYRKVKVWYNNGRLADPGLWKIILSTIYQDTDHMFRSLAEDWSWAKEPEK